jgi:hypothetical protein
VNNSKDFQTAGRFSIYETAVIIFVPNPLDLRLSFDETGENPMKKIIVSCFALGAAFTTAVAGTISVNQPAPQTSPAAAFSNSSLSVKVIGNNTADLTGATTITLPTSGSVTLSFSGNYTASAGEEGSIAYYFVANLAAPGTVSYDAQGSVTVFGQNQSFDEKGTITPGRHPYSGHSHTAKIPINTSGPFTATITFTYTPSPTAESANGTNASAPPTLTLQFDQFAVRLDTTEVAALPPTQLLNISTRLDVQTGANVLIGGFIVSGTDQKKIYVRGLGPEIEVSGTKLADPFLELHDSSKTISFNDNWKVNAGNGSSQQAAIEATSIPPKNDLESAIVDTVPAGNAGYTAILRGNNNGTGIGQVEVYDLDQAASSQLANISTRGLVGTGDDVMIGGVIVGPTGNGASTVVVRGIGPSLTAKGVAGALQDPSLELHDTQGTVVASNDNWQTSPDQVQIKNVGLAPTDTRESALMASPDAGHYTAIVRGVNNTTGVALVEVFRLQQ